MNGGRFTGAKAAAETGGNEARWRWLQQAANLICALQVLRALHSHLGAQVAAETSAALQARQARGPHWAAAALRLLP